MSETVPLESRPGVRDEVDALKRRLVAALWPIFGEGESRLPFGLSKTRLEVNLYCLSGKGPPEAVAACAQLIQEILESGLAETETSFYVGKDPDRCVIRQHLDGGEWFDRN